MFAIIIRKNVLKDELVDSLASRVIPEGALVAGRSRNCTFLAFPLVV
jgi:hypothetical protein